MSDLGQTLILYLQGTLQALILLVVSGVLSVLIGLCFMVVDLAGHKITSFILRIYSWLAQTTPPLILLFLAFYGSTWAGWNVSPIVAAIVAFTFFAAAYYYEIFRAAYEGVPSGQAEAARALGIPYFSFVRSVLLPQVLRIASGPLIGRTTVLFKETSLASAISTAEIMSVANGRIYAGGNPLVHVLIAGAIYATINIALIRFERRLSAKVTSK
ncbi:ABC transporter permease subunit (plasmid) [Agrobacterium tumefaciens]|uniref:amino acid ABC transporter permease n=1 Tax=Agrobacterium tumefaciens TaxID=358 RepID=UPI0015749DFD|nr:ABC transporter permease subunit [Agrobacterium tumefaciens]NSZ66149.1 ABC transporter permease subunit [Agrobacterium tumefaciens]NTA72520.1 ABC transporter permease subunit [Agrobacterium tumefaciens]WIE41761.1 ABC transporter permease subunit [Agrobacterium tumefaciens]